MIWVLTAGMIIWSSSFSAIAQVEKTDPPTLILADEMQYDENTQIITATGNVEIEREGSILLADEVVYNQETDTATANGNVTLVDDDGTVMFFEQAEITGDLKEGLAREVRVLLADN